MTLLIRYLVETMSMIRDNDQRMSLRENAATPNLQLILVSSLKYCYELKSLVYSNNYCSHYIHPQVFVCADVKIL